MEFKGRQQRAYCYEARDAFFVCHEKQPKGVDTKVACKDLFDKFEKACGHKWTEHFLRKHSYEKFKDKLMKDGVDAVDDEKMR
jgi:cytochrome c oxidase assembly factor 6